MQDFVAGTEHKMYLDAGESFPGVRPGLRLELWSSRARSMLQRPRGSCHLVFYVWFVFGFMFGLGGKVNVLWAFGGVGAVVTSVGRPAAFSQLAKTTLLLLLFLSFLQLVWFHKVGEVILI